MSNSRLFICLSVCLTVADVAVACCHEHSETPTEATNAHTDVPRHLGKCTVPPIASASGLARRIIILNLYENFCCCCCCSDVALSAFSHFIAIAGIGIGSRGISRSISISRGRSIGIWLLPISNSTFVCHWPADCFCSFFCTPILMPMRAISAADSSPAPPSYTIYPAPTDGGAPVENIAHCVDILNDTRRQIKIDVKFIIARNKGRFW